MENNMIKSSLHFTSSQICVPWVLIGILMDVFSLYGNRFFLQVLKVDWLCVCVRMCVRACVRACVCVSESRFILSGDVWAIRKHSNDMR